MRGNKAESGTATVSIQEEPLRQREGSYFFNSEFRPMPAKISTLRTNVSTSDIQPIAPFPKK